MPECTCQQRYEDALAAGDDGLAAFIETKCEIARHADRPASVTETGTGAPHRAEVGSSANAKPVAPQNDSHVIREES